MKKILVMTMAMLAMAFAFTSCGGDDDDDIIPGGGTNTDTKEMRTIYFYDSGSPYLNRQFKLTIGSETITLKVDDLKKEAGMPEMILEISKSNEAAAKKDGIDFNVYSYEIPADKHGAFTINSDYSLKEGVDLPESIYFFFGAYTYVGTAKDMQISGKCTIGGGVYKDKAQEYLNLKNGLTLAAGTVK